MCNTGLIITVDFSSDAQAVAVNDSISVPGVKEGDYILLAWLQGDEDKTAWFSNFVEADDYVKIKSARSFVNTDLFTLVIARTL